MRIVGAELAKLWRTTPVLAFLLGCIGLNLLILASGPTSDYPRYVATQSSTTGSGDDSLSARLAQDRATQTNVFSGYDITALARTYLERIDYSPAAAQAITVKYQLAAPIVAQRATDQRAIDLYYASDTGQVHGFVFGTLLGAVTVEAFLLAIIIGTQIRSVEEHRGPGSVIYTTRAGRAVLRAKLAAVLIAAAVAQVLLAVATASATVWRYQLAGVWHDSVASSFHHLVDPVVGDRPFFTWLDLDVGGYLAATIAVSLALTLVAALAAFTVGALLPNNYLGVGLLLLTGGTLLATPFALGASTAGMILGLNPVWLWLQQSAWFTDGGPGILIPWFETVGTLAGLLLAGLSVLATGHRFVRMDLA